MIRVLRVSRRAVLVSVAAVVLAAGSAVAWSATVPNPDPCDSQFSNSGTTNERITKLRNYLDCRSDRIERAIPQVTVTVTAPATSSTSSTTTSPTTTSSTTSSSSTTTSPTSSTTTGSETTLTAYVTGYSWWDNTPPGSADISHPIIHQQAAGTGTFADPTTMAVGHSLATGSDVLDWPAGTKFYIADLRKYFIVEDTCGDGPTPQNGACHVGYPSGASTWLDVWVDGRNTSNSAANQCMNAMTGNHTVIRNPVAGKPVTAGTVC